MLGRDRRRPRRARSRPGPRRSGTTARDLRRAPLVARRRRSARCSRHAHASAPPRSASPRAARGRARRGAREPAAELACVDDQSRRPGAPSSHVPHHTTPPAASVAMPMPAARLAAASGVGPAQVDDERDAERGRRLVLAHDESRRGARSSASARAGPDRRATYGRTGAHGVAAAAHEQRRAARRRVRRAPAAAPAARRVGRGATDDRRAAARRAACASGRTRRAAPTSAAARAPTGTRRAATPTCGERARRPAPTVRHHVPGGSSARTSSARRPPAIVDAQRRSCRRRSRRSARRRSTSKPRERPRSATRCRRRTA